MKERRKLDREPIQPTPPEPQPVGSESSPADEAQTSAQESMQLLMKQVGELREYATHYLSAQVDRAKAKVRRIAILAAVGVLGAFAAFATILASIWLLLGGLAAGLGEAFGGRVWLGNVIVASTILALFGFAYWWFVVRRQRAARNERVEQYARRTAYQRAKYGRSAHDRAHANGTAHS